MKNKMHFNIDTPTILAEILINPNMGCFVIPLRVLQTKFAEIAGEAIRINDPKLNILMLEMKLYDAKHSEIQELIELQKQKL